MHMCVCVCVLCKEDAKIFLKCCICDFFFLNKKIRDIRKCTFYLKKTFLHCLNWDPELCDFRACKDRINNLV